MSQERKGIAAALLTVSAAGFGTWVTNEELSSQPIIPTKGDVLTIGHALPVTKTEPASK